MKRIMQIGIVAVLGAGTYVLMSSIYTVSEVEQVIITQFGSLKCSPGRIPRLSSCDVQSPLNWTVRPPTRRYPVTIDIEDLVRQGKQIMPRVIVLAVLALAGLGAWTA